MRGFILALIGAVLCTLESSAVAQTVNTFAVNLNQPKGIAFDGAGSLYVANSGNGSIIRIARNGVTTTFASGFTNLGFIAFDPAGNLYATNTVGPAATRQVSQIDPSGTVSTFITQVSGPIAFDGSGNLYGIGSSAIVTASIVKVTPNGSLSVLGSVPYNSALGLLGLRADAAGNVFVSGGPVNFSTFHQPSYIAELLPNGQVIQIASGPDWFSSPFSGPIALDTSDNIYLGVPGGINKITLSHGGCPGRC